MKWTEELVVEFAKSISPDFNIDLLKEFKQLKAIVPSNCIVLTYILNGICYTVDNNFDEVLKNEINNPNFKVTSCDVNGTIFYINDTVYNSHRFKKYGGKWSNYLVKIDSLDFRVKRDDKNNIISSLLVINHFYDVYQFIKR